MELVNAIPDTGYYSVYKTDSMETLERVFPDGKADTLNWLFCSTSGVHGTYTSLLDIEREIKNGSSGEWLTVLIVKPQIVQATYGEVFVDSLERVQWLKGLVSSTIKAIKCSQEGNVDDDCPDAKHEWTHIFCDACDGILELECRHCKSSKIQDSYKGSYLCYCADGGSTE